MTGPRSEGPTLGYCTNLFAGGSWQEALESLERFVAGGMGACGAGGEAGPGLWLSAAAARGALLSGGCDRLRDLERTPGARILSLNGFPYGDFHRGVVKGRVFLPAWDTPARLRYTLDLARIARDIAAPGRTMGISTLPLGHRSRGTEPTFAERAARNLARAAVATFVASRESGAEIHIDLEPEPMCLLETSADVVRFFRSWLLTHGADEVRRHLGGRPAAAERLLLERVKVCYDACHAAVRFEAPEEALARYDAAGIGIGRVQVSSALRIVFGEGSDGPDPLRHEGLRALARDRHLHQVVGRDGRGAREFEDLPPALAAWSTRRPDGEYRVHCHVPVFLPRASGFLTTRDHVVRLAEIARRRYVAPHWEIETYTRGFVPEDGGDGGIAGRVARELEWFVPLWKRLKSAP